MPLESSPGETEVVAPKPDEAEGAVLENSAEQPDAKTAESSAADVQDAKEPESLLDAVTGALEKDKEPQEQPSGSEEDGKDKLTKAGQEGEAEESKSDEVPEEFHKHPAWQRIMSERDSYKDRAEGYDRITQAVETAGITNEEFNTGFNIMALMRSDPLKAREALKPYMDALDQHAGVQLPADLQEQVDGGYVTADHASEIARLRAQNGHLAAQREEISQQGAYQQQVHAGNDMASAVTSLEQQWAASDPDFERKQPMVQSRVNELIASGEYTLETTEDALAITQKAMDDVNSWVGAFKPQKQPITPLTGGASVATKPDIGSFKSLRDVVDAAAEGTI